MKIIVAIDTGDRPDPEEVRDELGYAMSEDQFIGLKVGGYTFGVKLLHVEEVTPR